jgi:two-component system chemotaxis sensor kinase CheA
VADVERVANIAVEQIVVAPDRTVILGGERPIPLVSFAAVLDMANDSAWVRQTHQPVIVIGCGERRIALGVDMLLDERDIVVHRLGPRLSGVRSIAGVCVLGEAELVLSLRSAYVRERAALLARTLRPPLAPASATSHRRILVIDDSPSARLRERTILQSAGYDVVTASDGEEALRALREQHVDLIISDIDMPKLDGFELTVAVRASRLHQSLPVILLTGRTNERDASRGREAGADALFSKRALDPDALLARIAELL